MSSNFGYYSNDYLYDELYDSLPDIRKRSSQFLFPPEKPQKFRYLGLLYSAGFCGVFLIFFIILYLTSESWDPRDPYCDPNYFPFLNTTFCYRVHLETANFTESSRICQEEGANLASIHSEDENDFLVGLSRSLLQSNHSQIEDLTVWIGLTYNYSNKTWHWTDNSPVDYQKWMFGEPAYLETDRWTTLSLNIRTERAMQWNNHGNYHKNHFVCKKAINQTYQK